MLDTDVNLLLDDAATDLLIDLHAEGSGGHIPDASGLANIVLVRHALVDGTVALDIN